MKKGIYFIKDDVTGSFDMFGVFVNDGTAVRAFRTACRKSDDVPVTDLSLFNAGSFDTDTGCIILSDAGHPEFCVRGEVGLNEI